MGTVVTLPGVERFIEIQENFDLAESRSRVTGCRKTHEYTRKFPPYRLVFRNKNQEKDLRILLRGPDTQLEEQLDAIRDTAYRHVSETQLGWNSLRVQRRKGSNNKEARDMRYKIEYPDESELWLYVAPTLNCMAKTSEGQQLVRVDGGDLYFAQLQFRTPSGFRAAYMFEWQALSDQIVPSQEAASLVKEWEERIRKGGVSNHKGRVLGISLPRKERYVAQACERR